MSYDFQDATPVKVTGGGRQAGPNPFVDVIAAIALKTNEQGEPLAKAFVEKHETGARKTHVNRIKTQMSAAGEKNDPPVTVRVDAKPVQVKGKDSDTETLITFWTVKRQTRPRKDATATASTEQSTAVASA